ncbi:hypothetical protein [Enterococcus phage PEF1]
MLYSNSCKEDIYLSKQANIDKAVKSAGTKSFLRVDALVGYEFCKCRNNPRLHFSLFHKK